mmetsp:Transcript_20672/g.70975  ORF Transcript_20672/g.70975 Transcript_20672/m.70975 type:complete len:271 (+) Transcript_20672:27-839(+)
MCIICYFEGPPLNRGPLSTGCPLSTRCRASGRHHFAKRPSPRERWPSRRQRRGRQRLGSESSDVRSTTTVQSSPSSRSSSVQSKATMVDASTSAARSAPFIKNSSGDTTDPSTERSGGCGVGVRSTSGSLFSSCASISAHRSGASSSGVARVGTAAPSSCREASGGRSRMRGASRSLIGSGGRAGSGEKGRAQAGVAGDLSPCVRRDSPWAMSTDQLTGGAVIFGGLKRNLVPSEDASSGARLTQAGGILAPRYSQNLKLKWLQFFVKGS